MSTSQFLNFACVVAIVLILTDCCYSRNINNGSLVANGFSPAVATWYGSPIGAGSDGGACGFKDDVEKPPYNGMITAGNPFLFKSGKGCGNCYQVRCTEHPSCSGNPVFVTVTDECPGCSDAIHFDLSGKAFGSLAKPGQADKLRNAGKINIQYQSVRCHYSASMTFKIDAGSNSNYLAFTIEFVDGDGDIGSVLISSPNTKGWLSMQQSWGATWKVDLSNGIKGPFSVKVTTIESKMTFIANNVIPANWVPGQSYHS